MLRQDMPEAKVVICTVQTDPRVIEEAFQRGAVGFGRKQSAHADLAAAIRAVLVGDRFVSPALRDGKDKSNAKDSTTDFHEGGLLNGHAERNEETTGRRLNGKRPLTTGVGVTDRMERLLLTDQEMGGPLNVVIGRMEYLLERGADRETAHSLKAILSQGQQLVVLRQQQLDEARLTLGVANPGSRFRSREGYVTHNSPGGPSICCTMGQAGPQTEFIGRFQEACVLQNRSM